VSTRLLTRGEGTAGGQKGYEAKVTTAGGREQTSSRNGYGKIGHRGTGPLRVGEAEEEHEAQRRQLGWGSSDFNILSKSKGSIQYWSCRNEVQNIPKLWCNDSKSNCPRRAKNGN